MGRVTHHNEFGVKHFNVAENRLFLALAGEFVWRSPENFSFNLLSGSLMRPEYPTPPGEGSVPVLLATELFRRMGARSPVWTGNRSLTPNRPPSAQEWFDILSSAEFRQPLARSEIDDFYQKIHEDRAQMDYSEFIEAFRRLSQTTTKSP